MLFYYYFFLSLSAYGTKFSIQVAIVVNLVYLFFIKALFLNKSSSVRRTQWKTGKSFCSGSKTNSPHSTPWKAAVEPLQWHKFHCKEGCGWGVPAEEPCSPTTSQFVFKKKLTNKKHLNYELDKHGKTLFHKDKLALSMSPHGIYSKHTVTKCGAFKCLL